MGSTAEDLLLEFTCMVLEGCGVDAGRLAVAMPSSSASESWSSPTSMGVLRALHDGKLVVEAEGTRTVHEVRPSAVLLEEEQDGHL